MRDGEYGSIDRFMRHTAKTASQWCVRTLAAHDRSRRLLNAWYRRLRPPHRALFHKHFARIFTDAMHAHYNDAKWCVEFCGKEVMMPLTAERYWLDWDMAVSLIGQDIEVKETYARLILSDMRPTVFLDIGTNYGLHSLLFLIHGIRTISFEPNALCHGYFRELCALNGVVPDLRPVALGRNESEVALWFPAGETWLGSTSVGVRERWSGEPRPLASETVPQKRLDDYLEQLPSGGVLAKIDTEGNECDVLVGALETLRRTRMLVIFEAWPGSGRPPLYRLLSEENYRIAPLPWSPEVPTRFITAVEFETAGATNFIALPAEAAGAGGQGF